VLEKALIGCRDVCALASVKNQADISDAFLLELVAE
jgi:hypothetical protein